MSIADLILKNVVSFRFTKQGVISGSQTFLYYVFEFIAYYDLHEFGRNQWKEIILHLTAYLIYCLCERKSVMREKM